MLLALDDYPNALRAADFAAKLVQQSEGELHAVHVRPTLTLFETLLSSRQHLLEYWAYHDGNAAMAAPRTASRARVADIAVTLVRLESDRLWMLAERPQAHYLMNWLKHAGAALEP